MGQRALRQAVVACIGCVVLATAAVVGAVGASSAEWRDESSKPSASAMFAATAPTMWSSSDKPEWICSLVPSCVDAEVERGAGEVYLLKVSLESAGLPIPSELATLPVRVEVTNRVPGQSMDLGITASNALGRFASTATLAISPQGRSSRVSYETTSTSGSGVLGAVVTRQLAESLQSQLTDASRNFAERMSDQPQVTVSLQPRPTAPGVKRSRVTTVVGQVTAVYPPGFAQPTATGRLKVWLGDRLVCSTAVRDSRGVCRLRLPAAESTPVLVAASGVLSTGLPFSTGSRVLLRASGGQG